MDTVHTHYDNVPHGYLLFPKLTRTADDSLDEIAAEAMRYLGAPAGMGALRQPEPAARF